MPKSAVDQPADADPAGTAAAVTPTVPWWSVPVDRVATELAVDPATGLTSAEAAARLERHGPNELAVVEPEPWWKELFGHFTDGLTLILFGAAVLAAIIGDLKDAVVISIVLIFNALLGYYQERRAQKSLDALADMMVATARVRRDGAVHEIPGTDIVPGDIVLLDAGDSVPADGRIVQAAALAVAEAALTGESAPVDKTTDAVATDAGLGDRDGYAFMQTVVTRGRGELLVTGTGTHTEIGRLSDLIASAPDTKTPLQEQLQVLASRLSWIAGGAVLLVVALGMAQGSAFGDLITRAIALAVAAIPEGLPAVVTVTLSVGMFRMAKRQAIVKRLASVETLGSTTVICSDKTGTLTLNEMTADGIWIAGSHLDVTGRGYGPDGEIVPADGEPTPDADALARLVAVGALCNESTVRDEALIGDPTEGAFVVLAHKTGVDVEALRAERPRLAEIPFDSATKYMATFHRDGDGDGDGDGSVLVAVKGASDVLVRRCTHILGPDGPAPLDDAGRARCDDEIDHYARRGRRVLAVAAAHVAAADFDADGDIESDLEAHLDDLTLLGLVAIVDPARPEARDAVDKCHTAGIDVKMITGDHKVTAAAIAGDLGITGDVVSGNELDAMDDEELRARVHGIGVFARVSPEHKMRIVQSMQSHGDVVAMTGDGVNDAPALETADIGIAMGITGTEVSKQAAAMILTDDNFATIERAVEEGRTIYENIVHFVRFQISTNIGAVAIFLVAASLGFVAPFTPLMMLWVNLICDGPPAMALGLDPPRPNTMEEPPRRRDANILTLHRFGYLIWFGAIMTVGTLAVYWWKTNGFDRDLMDSATVGVAAATVTWTTFIFFQLFNVFNARAEHQSTFVTNFFRNGKLWSAIGVVAALQFVAVYAPFAQDLFGTTGISATDWLVAIGVASSILWLEELRKLGARLLGVESPATVAATRPDTPVATPVAA